MTIDASGGVGVPATHPNVNHTAVPSRFDIPVKECCGLLACDYCDCAEFAAEASAMFDNPIVWDRGGRTAA